MHKLSNTQNWWQLTSIQIGGAICMPILMVGQQISQKYGLWPALAAIALGNLLLFLLGLVYTVLASQRKTNTIENAVYYFGRYGAQLMGTIMIMVCVGWFAIQLNVMSLSGLHLLGLPSLYHPIMTAILGAAITVGALFGIKGINKFADITMPLLIGTIGYALYKAYQMPATHKLLPSFSWSSVTLVVASTLFVVIDIPTYYRLSKSLKDGWLSIALLYLIATPLIQIAGAFIALHSEGSTIIEVFTSQGGILWQLWVLSFLILAGWTTNNTNLYSAVVTLETLTSSISNWWATILLGIVGTLLACYPLLDHYEGILSLMAILVIAMGAVVLVNYIFEYLYKHQLLWSHFALNIFAWCIGVVFGFLHFSGALALTASVLCDAFLASSACAGLGILFIEKRKIFTW